jgi:hypothetical protein
MKYVQVTATPDQERTPQIITLLASSSHITESRLYDWNVRRNGATALFEITGDRTAVRHELPDTVGVRWFDTTPVIDSRFNLLALFKPAEVPLMNDVFGTLTREKLIVAKPVIYRDGEVHARIVGPSSVLQASVRDLPSDVNVVIERIGDFDRSRETPVSTLTDRQREALLEAYDLGYYEQPRRATHEEIATRLCCAPHTASEHLQKAESKVLKEVFQLEFEQ